MKIVADENLALVRELFAGTGELVCKPGRAMTAGDVRDADVLLVRSVTRVDADLLAGSRVGFVGTATIGTDHLDLDWLRQAGIRVAAAPGCNARSVVEYVLSGLCDLWRRGRLDWENAVFGVVGLGNVGARLARVLQGLGLNVLGSDPLVCHDDIEQQPLEVLLREANVLSLHTPLTRGGAFPTWHLLDEARLSSWRHPGMLINSGRGAVIDNQALRRLVEAGFIQGQDVILDVWEHEPEIDAGLLDLIGLGTPHIAGYSQEGKWQGSLMIHEALADFARLGPVDVAGLLPSGVTSLTLEGSGWQALAGLIEDVYPIRRDDADLRHACRLPVTLRAAAFDALRKQYWPRREFSAAMVQIAPGVDERTMTLARALGFRLAE